MGFFVVLGAQSRNGYLKQKKRGQAPALQMQFNTTPVYQRMKGSQEKFLTKLSEERLREMKDE